MVINLHTTQSPVSRSERMKINENWQKIIEGLSRLQYQINLLAGGQEVEELLKRITDAINGAIEAATDANNATSNANVAADAANHVVQTAIEKITVVEKLLIELEVQQEELEQIKSSLILVSEAAQEATANANSATMNANQASDAANAAKENLTNAVITKLNEADTAITNAITAATTATQAAESIEGWGTATAWNSTTSYLKNNVVTDNGSTWQVTKQNINSKPTITNTDWILLAQRGVDGTGAVSSVNGKLPDETGNVDLDFGEGTVQKVNGKSPDNAGEVTLVAKDLGSFSGSLLEDSSVTMMKLAQEVIDAIQAGGVGGGNSFFVAHPLVTTEVSQKTWEIPVDAYDPALDSLMVFHNASILNPTFWTVTGNTSSGYKVNIPDNPITTIDDNNVLVMVLKNVSTNLPEDVSGTRITNASVGIQKLSQEVRDALETGGFIDPLEVIDTLDSDRTDAALSARAGKELKQKSDANSNAFATHEAMVATTTKLGHIKPDGTTITVAADGKASAKQVEIVNNTWAGGSDKAASAEVIKELNIKIDNIPKPTNLMNDRITIYVSSSIGNDSNNGLTESAPVKTIDNALYLVKNLGAKEREIRLRAGDVFNEDIYAYDIHGSGLDFTGNLLNPPTVKGIILTRCTAPIGITYIEVKQKGSITNPNWEAAKINSCRKVSISSCTFDGLGRGVSIYDSNVRLWMMTMNNITDILVDAREGSICYTENMSGTNPAATSYGYCSSASIILGWPGSVTTKVAQLKENNGQIFF